MRWYFTAQGEPKANANSSSPSPNRQCPVTPWHPLLPFSLPCLPLLCVCVFYVCVSAKARSLAWSDEGRIRALSVPVALGVFQSHYSAPCSPTVTAQVLLTFSHDHTHTHTQKCFWMSRSKGNNQKPKDVQMIQIRRSSMCTDKSVSIQIPAGWLFKPQGQKHSEEWSSFPKFNCCSCTQYLLK